MNTPEIIGQFFADAAADSREINEENLRAWLWFTCPAQLRLEVEQGIRADERWISANSAPLCPRCNIPMSAYAGWGRSGTWWVRLRLCPKCGSRTTKGQPRSKERPAPDNTIAG